MDTEIEILKKRLDELKLKDKEILEKQKLKSEIREIERKYSHFYNFCKFIKFIFKRI